MLRNGSGHRYTYGDYVQWTGDERWELVDGQAFDITPAPSRLHQQVVVRMLFQIGNHLRGHRCQVYVAPFDVRLPKADEPDEQIVTVVQPDVVVICDPAKLDDAGCRGAPDWVVEVLSPRTSARDQELKRDVYARSGVREYCTSTLFRASSFGTVATKPPEDSASQGAALPRAGSRRASFRTSRSTSTRCSRTEVFAD